MISINLSELQNYYGSHKVHLLVFKSKSSKTLIFKRPRETFFFLSLMRSKESVYETYSKPVID